MTSVTIEKSLPDLVMRHRHRWAQLDLWVLMLAGGGVVLAIVSARNTPLFEMNDAGLASVLPVSYWVALILICSAFALGMIRNPVRERLLAVPAVALAVAVFGVVPIASTFPRDHVSVRHVGIIDHLASAGWSDGLIDAYFNWPGFFSVFAFLGSAAGDADLVPYVRWAPLVARVAMMVPTLLLMRALVKDRRTAWVAVWIVMLWDWVDQDYFAPQTFGLSLHLVVLALVAGWLLVPRAGSPIPSDHTRQRVGVYLVAILIAVAIVPAHQLTPVATTMTLGALVLLRRLPQLGVAVVTGLVVAVWLVIGAAAYQSGHDVVTLPDFGALLGDNVGSRVSGSDLHHSVVLERMVFTVGLWLLAGLGLLRAWRSGRSVLVPVVIAVVPFLMGPMQAYGGEMLLRVHLLSLPGMALLATFLLAPPGSHRIKSAVAVLLVSLAVLPAMLVARYGNDRLETFTLDEVAAVEQLYTVVPEGGLLVSAVPYVPWRGHDYATYDYETLLELAESGLDPEGVWDELLSAMEEAGSGAVVVTTTAYEAAEMLGDALDLSAMEEKLASDPRFELVHRSKDGRVYLYRG